MERLLLGKQMASHISRHGSKQAPEARVSRGGGGVSSVETVLVFPL